MAHFDRPVLLKEDFDALVITLDALREEYKKWAKVSTEGSKVGDWHDNFDYEESMRQMGMISKRLQDLSELLRTAQVLSESDLKHDLQRVSLGSKVTVRDEKDEERKYYIGSHTKFRSDTAIDGYMIISYASPLGRGLVGKERGDEAKVKIGDKLNTLCIVDVR